MVCLGRANESNTNPNNLNKLDIDSILITTYLFGSEISQQLIQFGIDKEIITSINDLTDNI